MRPVQLAGFTLDEDHPPVFLAEIGTYFDKDIELGKYFIRQIKEAGADMVKGEILHDINVALDDETTMTYFTGKEGLYTERWRGIIERKAVAIEKYRELFKLCSELELPLVLSVYDFMGADFAMEIGAAALKIASQNMVHAPLIRYAAQLSVKNKKPLIIDTGKSTLEEISREVQWIRDAGCEDIIIEHSPAAMPAPLANHDLRMLLSFKKIFDIPVGISCHHRGDEMLYAAVALGASVIEKPICMDPDMKDLDFYFAMPVSELKTAVRKCRNIYEALGSYMRTTRKPTSERMGLVANKDVLKGMKIDYDSTGFAFPAKGIPVEKWDIVSGRVFAKGLKKGQVISWADVDFSENK